MDANALATIGAAVVVGMFSLIVAVRGKTHDGRITAEAAILGMPAPIIEEQNKRIDALQKSHSDLWQQLQDMFSREQECRDELREMRHQNRDLLQKIIALQSKVESLERGK